MALTTPQIRDLYRQRDRRKTLIPQAKLTADVIGGDAPLDVVFTDDTTLQTDVDEVRFADGEQAAFSVDPSFPIAKTYTTPGVFKAVIETDDVNGLLSRNVVRINVLTP